MTPARVESCQRCTEMSKGTGLASHNTAASQAFGLLHSVFTVDGLQPSTNIILQMDSTVSQMRCHGAIYETGHNSETCPSDLVVQLRLRMCFLGNG
jgi:hypothetical protein